MEHKYGVLLLLDYIILVRTLHYEHALLIHVGVT